MTIPSTIREILELEPGSTVMYKVTDRGIILSPCEILEKPAYTSNEWKKIEKFVAEKEKAYKTSTAAKKHIKSL